jgi:hypothetical protein
MSAVGVCRRRYGDANEHDDIRNTSQASGGVGSATSTVTFSNTILGNNTGGDCSASNSTINAGHTLVANGASAAACGIGVGGVNGNIVGQDPLLAPLADNGGPTQTRALDAVSPALNAGSVALAISGNDPLNYDQRGFGFPRTLNGGVDIGAYQHQGDRVFADGSGTGALSFKQAERQDKKKV